MANRSGNTGKDKRTLEELGVSIDDFESGRALQPALAAAYAQLGVAEDGADATIYVSLIDGKTQKEARIWDGPVEDWDMKALAQKFGSGDYRVKLYTRIETGQKVQQQNKIITWQLSAEEDARLKLLRENPQALQGQQVPAAAVVTPESIAAAIKAAMPQQTGPTMAEIMGMVTGLVTAMRPAVTAAPQPVAPAFNPMDVVKLVVGAMNESRASRDPDDDAPRRGANSNDIWLRVIDKMGPLFEVVARGKLTPGTPALGAPAETPGGALNDMGADTIIGNDSIQPEGDGMNAAEKMKLRMGLRFLISQAESNSDPATYANVALDAIGEEAAEQFLAQPDPLAVLTAIEPGVANHRKWFSDMIAECRDLLAEDTGEGGAS